MRNAPGALLYERVVGVGTRLDWVKSGIEAMPGWRAHRGSLKALRELEPARTQLIQMRCFGLATVALQIPIRAVVGNHQQKVWSIVGPQRAVE